MSQSAADRNLLVGILALQMDFISKDAVIAAMNAWVLDKARPLGQIMVEQGALLAANRELLELLVSRHLEMHGNDAQRSLAALGPVRHNLGKIADADVQASLAHVAATPTGPVPEATGPYVPPSTLPPHARFHILRAHAKGGLGEVYVARDEELRREVALKEIQERHAHSPESRARFLLEAEITGGLEHPGIVPVYGLGAYSDGRPFYAMRLVKGESLKDAIARYRREKDNLAVGERSLRLRQLLTRFVAVCNAVAYAHSRGVLHRDLKPANILLGPYGETLVVDWGLAKVLGRAETAAEAPLRSSRDGEAELTQTGAALGTPAYMSPEQAAGRTDQLGPASDVYSLGATLYALLTGRAPFAEDDVGAVLGKVQRGDFAPPQQVESDVPPALDAVCLRAMALKPEERYATPRELGEEIERWLADEPVRAYREPLPARLGRWLQRHQTLTVGAGALLLAGVIALAVITFLVGQAQQETAEALQKEEQARQATADALKKEEAARKETEGALKKEEAARKERALAQVNALLHTDPRAVPALLAGLEATRQDVLPRLRELWVQQELWEQWVQQLPGLAHEGWFVDQQMRQGRVGLALLQVQPALVKNWLCSWMLEAEDPREVLLVRDGLRPYRAELREWLWQRADREATGPQRFRALVALAAYDPEDPRWKGRGEVVLTQLLTANPLYLGAWAEGLRPVRGALLQPLAEVFRGRNLAEHKHVAATLLADYAADRPPLLAELLLDSDARQYAALRAKMFAQVNVVHPLLHAELQKTAGAAASDQDKDRLASRQANAALCIGASDRLWPLLQHSPDPSRRTWITHKLAGFWHEPVVLLQRLRKEKDVSVRRALLLSLGEYPFDPLPVGRMDLEVARLVQQYRDDPDPGIHGAIEWVLHRWKQDDKLPKLRNHRTIAPKGTPTWYINGQGQTLTVIPGPVEFQMGSPESDPDRLPNEAAHRRRIPRSFAMGTKEVTVAEFRRFLKANPEVAKELAPDLQAAGFLKKFSPAEEGPMVAVSWYTAAAYCNWLSQQEGLPDTEWCYPKGAGQIRPGMMMEKGWLKREGYRLPTEAEWEYACRAGAVTSRFYGRAEVLLGKHAWYAGNAGEKAHPVGRLRPNDLGLFDMLGNVAEWCQDRYDAYPIGVVEDAEDPDRRDTDSRVYRGGAYFNHATSMRAAQRTGERPAFRFGNVGFRVARTID
jgi:formylglycine-generating enzyme required for sulfatase activity